MPHFTRAAFGQIDAAGIATIAAGITAMSHSTRAVSAPAHANATIAVISAGITPVPRPTRAASVAAARSTGWIPTLFAPVSLALSHVSAAVAQPRGATPVLPALVSLALPQVTRQTRTMRPPIQTAVLHDFAYLSPHFPSFRTAVFPFRDAPMFSFPLDFSNPAFALRGSAALHPLSHFHSHVRLFSPYGTGRCFFAMGF
jgi:hypothetical protein